MPTTWWESCHCGSAPGRPPEMNLKVTIEHSKCMGTGSCVMLAAEYFEPGADGKSLVWCDGASWPGGDTDRQYYP
jgi:ferredoxin